MYINREGNYDDGKQRSCTCCGSLFIKTSKTVTLCNKCNSKRVKAQPLEKKIWRRAKSRSILKDLEFNISVEDIVLPKVCPILGIELKENIGKSGSFNNSYSLDRKDSNKGYIKGNVWIISALANTMKNNATKEQLHKFADWVKTEMD